MIDREDAVDDEAEDSEAAAENPDAGLPDNGPVW